MTPLTVLDRRPRLIDATATPRRRSDVFSEGNVKLGEHVLTFSLPAVVTCPGSTSLCRTLCYVCKSQSRFRSDEVQDRYWANWGLSARPDFADLVVAAYSRLVRESALTRLHVSGDFYDAVYAGKWLRVMREVPSVFWFYTRSWRDPVVGSVMAEMAGLANVHVWYSCDAETGAPAHVPPRVRLAYMMVNERDVPSYPADLYFRDGSLVRSIAKSVNGTLVCPAENGVTRTTCERCLVCPSEPSSTGPRRTRNRG